MVRLGRILIAIALLLSIVLPGCAREEEPKIIVSDPFNEMVDKSQLTDEQVEILKAGTGTLRLTEQQVDLLRDTIEQVLEEPVHEEWLGETRWQEIQDLYNGLLTDHEVDLQIVADLARDIYENLQEQEAVEVVTTLEKLSEEEAYVAQELDTWSSTLASSTLVYTPGGTDEGDKDFHYPPAQWGWARAWANYDTGANEESGGVAVYSESLLGLGSAEARARQRILIHVPYDDTDVRIEATVLYQTATSEYLMDAAGTYTTYRALNDDSWVHESIDPLFGWLDAGKKVIGTIEWIAAVLFLTVDGVTLDEVARIMDGFHDYEVLREALQKDPSTGGEREVTHSADSLDAGYYYFEVGLRARTGSVLFGTAAALAIGQVTQIKVTQSCEEPITEFNLSISSTAGGAVTTPGEGTLTYVEGTVVNLVATPDTGYRFVNWTGGVGTIANVNAASTTITMNGDYSITANFEVAPVVINEIAWMGTRANSADEWIELYNNTDEEINLTGWILKADDGTPNIELSGIILSNDFFLLEQGSDNTIKGIPADQIYTGALNNEGEKLELFDPYGNLIDIIDCSEKWFNGDRENRVSMERIDSSQPGSVSDNWESNNLITRRGEDADGKKINGMPGAENSVSKSSTKIFDGLPFSEGFNEIFLTKFGSPYVVKRAIVPENKTLIFGQGAVVQFYDDVSGITINGILKAIGTEDEKIVFTSRFDDEYGGSGGAADGDWNQIYFSPTSTDSELNNVIIRYGGAHRSDWDQYRVSAVMVEQSSVILKNSVFEKNKGKGLYFYLMDCSVSTSTIDNVQFLDHQKGLDSDVGVALRVEGGSLEIKNSFFKNNTYGLSLISCASLKVDNNIFEENETPIYVRGGVFSFTNNQMPGNTNGLNGIWLCNTNINQDTLWQANLPYIVDGFLRVSQNTIFTLAPGVVVKFYDSTSGMLINGTLKAIGTADKKIIFTSRTITPGSWMQIRFTSLSGDDSELVNTIIEYGGNSYSGSELGAAIKVEESFVSFEDSVFKDNKDRGLRLTNSFSTVDNVLFSGHQTGRQGYYPIALLIEGASPEIKNSTFEDNYYGIYIQSGDPVLRNLTFNNNKIDIYPTP